MAERRAPERHGYAPHPLADRPDPPGDLTCNTALFGIPRWPEALAGEASAAIFVALACEAAAWGPGDPRMPLAMSALRRCSHDPAARLVLRHIERRRDR